MWGDSTGVDVEVSFWAMSPSLWQQAAVVLQGPVLSAAVSCLVSVVSDSHNKKCWKEKDELQIH